MPVQARIRVVIADDHPIYREGIASAIKERTEFELVGAAADGREAVSVVMSLKPDVAVLDLRLPRLDGAQVMVELKRSQPGLRVLFLSAITDGPAIYRALQEGADGYVSKASTRSEICDAISAVSRGDVVVSSELQSELAGEIRLRRGEPRAALSPREHQVLALVAEGLSVQEIANRLNLSSSTVKTLLQRIYERLGVSERAAAVAEAMRRGLLA